MIAVWVLLVALVVLLAAPAAARAQPQDAAARVVAADGDGRADDVEVTWTGTGAGSEVRLRDPAGEWTSSGELSSSATSHVFHDQRQGELSVQVRDVDDPDGWQPADGVSVFLSDLEFHGVNVNRLLAFVGSDAACPAPARPDPAAWAPWLDLLRSSGLRIARSDAFWSDSEPSAPVGGTHRWRWSRPDLACGQADGRSDDAKARALAEHHIRWEPILDYGNAWAAADPSAPNAWMAPPSDPSLFAAYARAFAERYGPGGSFWAANPSLPYLPVLEVEIWNEPNLEHYWPGQGTAPARYADLFVDAADAIHAAGNGVHVLVGGLSGGTITEGGRSVDKAAGLQAWLQAAQLEQPGFLDESDGVGYHPYGTPVAQTYARIATARSALESVGHGDEELDVTETGWASPPVTSADRGAWLFDLAAQLPASDCRVGRLMVYTWVSDEASQGNPEDWFGITRRTLSSDGLAQLRASGSRYLDGVEAGRAARTGTGVCG